jgi:solute carrier family 25 carnitine/acylcarnitine transporter 20/29
VKTKVQQRALAGERYRGVTETLRRLIRGLSILLLMCSHLTILKGPDPEHPKPFLAGMARLYRGLGVSAGRSIITHGLLWTAFDTVAGYIDSLPTS